MTLLDQLMRDEGCSLTPYHDTVGKLTIGYGRNLDDNGISRAEAYYLLTNDAADAGAAVMQELPWAEGLDVARMAVLINMAFNMGINGLLGFHKTLAFIKAGDYVSASSAMLSSKWAIQVGDRATRLAKQLLTGEWI